MSDHTQSAAGARLRALLDEHRSQNPNVLGTFHVYARAGETREVNGWMIIDEFFPHAVRACPDPVNCSCPETLEVSE